MNNELDRIWPILICYSIIHLTARTSDRAVDVQTEIQTEYFSNTSIANLLGTFSYRLRLTVILDTEICFVKVWNEASNKWISTHIEKSKFY
jgi:hypothetical protein